MTRGLVLRNAGRHADARDAYERALTLYEHKGAAPAAGAVRAELATLPG